MSEYKAKLFKNGGASKGLVFSETEHIIGAWIDGSPLYAKTVQCGQLRSSAGNMAIPHGITNLSKFIHVEGIARRNNGQVIPLPLTAVDSFSNQIVLYVDVTNINIYVGADQSINTSSEVTLFYTKTA